MASSPPRRRTVALSELVAGVMAPVAAKRGVAAASLARAWPELVGARYADCTFPEKIEWPRGQNGESGGVLRVRTEGPRAVLLQHELGQLTERINGYLGYGAIGRIRLVQGPVPRRKAAARSGPVAAADEATVAASVAGIGEGGLREALARLGRSVLAKRG